MPMRELYPVIGGAPNGHGHKLRAHSHQAEGESRVLGLSMRSIIQPSSALVNFMAALGHADS
jgi:hypothetical protein